MKKQFLACICLAAAAAMLLAACAGTPERKLNVRTDTAPVQALLPGIDIQECVWVDANSRAPLPAPDMYCMGVIALSPQQMLDMTSAFDWSRPEPDSLRIEEDHAYLAMEYYGATARSLQALLACSVFTEQNTPEFYYNDFYLAEAEGLLLFEIVTI